VVLVVLVVAAMVRQVEMVLLEPQIEAAVAVVVEAVAQ
jgi:hypothetical protein